MKIDGYTHQLELVCFIWMTVRFSPKDVGWKLAPHQQSLDISNKGISWLFPTKNGQIINHVFVYQEFTDGQLIKTGYATAMAQQLFSWAYFMEPTSYRRYHIPFKALLGLFTACQADSSSAVASVLRAAYANHGAGIWIPTFALAQNHPVL